MIATDDQQIIALFFARDERAVSETAKKYGAACMQTAVHILGSRQDAEECINDAYLALWHTIPPENPAHFAAFVLTMVRFRAINRVKQLTRDKRGGNHIRLDLDEESDLLTASDDVQEHTEQRMTADAVNRFLAELPDEQRIMFVKRYWHYHTAREIAKEMQLSESNVRVTLMRLRKKLEQFLRKEELL